MRPRRAKLFIAIAVAVVGVVVAFALAVPLIISSDAVKQRIIDQVTYLTGRKFVFRGEPSISLYPYLTVRLNDAVLANADGMGDEPFIEMETMTGKLEILPLFLGELNFARFRFVNPRINLRTGVDGRANWIMEQGAVGSQVSKGDKEGATDELEPPSPLADIKLGRFVIRDGIVTYHDDRSGRVEELTKLNVSFDWTSTSQAATGSGDFIWRGEPVSFNGGVDAPLALLAGGSSPLHFAFTATPLRLAFTGNALQLGGTQLEGDIQLTTPSVRRVVEWMGAPMGTGAILGAGAINGKINWLGPSVAISDATMELDGNAAEGALSATISDGLSSLQGTLAFETFDLTPYIEAIRARFAAAEAPWLSVPVTLALDSMGDLDLRVSTERLVAGSAEIGRTGATAILTEGQLVVTVGDAQLDEGTAEARLTVGTVDGAMAGSAQLKLRDVALGKLLEEFAGVTAFDGLTTASIDVKGQGGTLGDLIGGLTGKAAIAVTEGVFEGADIANLPEVFNDPQANPVEGSTAFTAAKASLAFAEGRVSSEDIQVDGADFGLRVAGSAGLLDPTIDARGVLTLTDPDTAPEDVPFLVDGTWTDWRISPDLGPPVERDQSAPEPAETPALPDNG